MNSVQAFLYGRHALRKIPSGQRDPGDYEGKHRKGPPRNGTVVWTDLYDGFAAITSAGPYRQLT